MYKPLTPVNKWHRRLLFSHWLKDENYTGLISFPDSKVNTCDLYTEEDSSNWTCKTTCNTHCHSSCQHFTVSGLICIDSIERSNQLGQEGSHYTCNMDEGTFFSQRHSRSQCCCQTNSFCDKCPTTLSNSNYMRSYCDSVVMGLLIFGSTNYFLCLSTGSPRKNVP